MSLLNNLLKYTEDVHRLYVDSVSSHIGARACLHADLHG